MPIGRNPTATDMNGVYTVLTAIGLADLVLLYAYSAVLTGVNLNILS